MFIQQNVLPVDYIYDSDGKFLGGYTDCSDCSGSGYICCFSYSEGLNFQYHPIGNIIANKIQLCKCKFGYDRLKQWMVVIKKISNGTFTRDIDSVRESQFK